MSKPITDEVLRSIANAQAGYLSWDEAVAMAKELLCWRTNPDYDPDRRNLNGTAPPPKDLFYIDPKSDAGLRSDPKTKIEFRTQEKPSSSMSKVYKYDLGPGVNNVKAPRGSTLVHCGLDGKGEPCVYYQVNESDEIVTHMLLLIGTGNAFDEKIWEHFQSFNQVEYVWHIFKKKPTEPSRGFTYTHPK